MTVDGRGDAAASETGADALAVVVGHARPHGVPDVAGHEEVLVLAVGDGRWDWRHGRDHEVWRARGRSVGDTGDICDLDDVGGPGEDGGGDRANGRLSPLAVAVDVDAAGGVGLFVPYLGVLASATDAEPPGQEDGGEEGDTTDSSSSDSSNSKHDATSTTDKQSTAKGKSRQSVQSLAVTEIDDSPDQKQSPFADPIVEEEPIPSGLTSGPTSQSNRSASPFDDKHEVKG